MGCRVGLPCSHKCQAVISHLISSAEAHVRTIRAFLTLSVGHDRAALKKKSAFGVMSVALSGTNKVAKSAGEAQGL